MNIGDKVRFLNDVGGGTITAFRPGGIVLVEDEDGFDVPIPQNEVVVIEESAPKVEKKKNTPKVEYGTSLQRRASPPKKNQNHMKIQVRQKSKPSTAKNTSNRKPLRQLILMTN